MIGSVHRNIRTKTKETLATLVKRVVARHEGQTVEETYRSAWVALENNLKYRILLRLTPRHGPKNNFRLRTHGLLLKHVKGYASSINVSLPENLATLIQGQAPFVVVTFHDGFRHLCKALTDHKRCYTRIAGPKAYMERIARQFGGSAYAHVVKDDSLSLIALRDAVEDGHAICSAIDYANRKGKKVYANPALIEFANRFNLNIVFIKTNITASGDVKLIGWGPYRNIAPEACVRMFLDLFNSQGETRVKLDVKRYNDNSDTKKRNRQATSKLLLNPFCDKRAKFIKSHRAS